MTTTPITVRRTDLAGLLTDLAAHACIDDELAFLNCVSLHTTDHPGGYPVLVASATDRFTLAQAHIPVVPTERPADPLPQLLLPLPAVHRARQWLRTHRTSRLDDKLHVGATTDNGHDTVTFRFDIGGGTLTEYAYPSDGFYPALGQLVTTTADQAFAPAAIRPEYLARFAETARRRGELLNITTHGDGHPAEITIGEHFRGLAMAQAATRADDQPTTPAPVFALPSETADPDTTTTDTARGEAA